MDTHDRSAKPVVSFRDAFRFWLKLGFISFGGPAGQIAIMHSELVERRRWISEKRFLHALNYCMLLPGPEAQQLATYIGWLLHHTRGGIIAGGLFVLPSVFILLGLSWIYAAFGQVAVVSGILYGFKPAVTAIVAHATIRMGRRALKNWLLWTLAGLAFVGIYFFHVPFPLIVLSAAIIGFVGSKLAPHIFHADGAHAVGRVPSRGVEVKFLIDDNDPPPAHALPSRTKFIRNLLVGLALWLAPMVALMAWQGWNGTFTQMGRFFTIAALVTFGGAYAVLPYVTQAAIFQYHWLTPSQIIDGLALGETTPGPLIMVLAFVGFLGGWQADPNVSGVGPQFGGVLGLCVATYFTFLPSFLFIFLGGPFVEHTRDKAAFSAPLITITAAVVGVILNLAVFFGQGVLFHDGSVDWFSVVLMIGSFVGLLSFKWNIIPVVLGCGVIGLVWKMTVS